MPFADELHDRLAGVLYCDEQHLTCIGLRSFNPARQPPERIRYSLLESTPLGTPYEDVLAFVRTRGWRYRVLEPGHGEIKHRSIEADYGEYYEFPFINTVEVYWKFDQHDRLKEIAIDIVSDAP